MSEIKLADYRVGGFYGKFTRAYASITTSVNKKDRSLSELGDVILNDPLKQEKAIAAVNLLGKVF
jgi:hypothetical protein